VRRTDPQSGATVRNENTIQEEKAMLPRAQEVAFAKMYRSARENTILDPKTTLLLHYASAMALACYP
jgi:hypothetical protein